MFIVVVRALIVIGLLLGIYIGLVAYMRWDRRKTLEEEHRAGAAPSLSEEDYVTRGLAAYERSWQRKSLLGIFFLPVLIGGILYALSQAA